MAKPLDFGVVDPNKLYTFDGLERILGITRSGIRALRGRGLKVLSVGRIGYVRGSSLIELVEAQGRAEFQELAQ